MTRLAGFSGIKELKGLLGVMKSQTFVRGQGGRNLNEGCLSGGRDPPPHERSKSDSASAAVPDKKTLASVSHTRGTAVSSPNAS